MSASQATSVFASLLLALALAGCASAPNPPQKDAVKGDQQADSVSDAKREEHAIAAVNAENSVFFSSNSALVDARAKDTLRRHAERLKASPKQKVLLVGFTDDRGSSAYNNAIAEMRVNAVHKVLREFGVKSSQLRRYSAGGEKNSTACVSDECRALMRRVELDYSVN